MNRKTQGELAVELQSGTSAQGRKVAEIVQRIHPDVLLLNEFDVDPEAPALARDVFHDGYLAVSQGGEPPLSYPYRYSALSNTGVASGCDLDNNGYANTEIPGASEPVAAKDRYGNDCFGFGWFPGQYSFVIYSKYPIRADEIRTFRQFLWKDMPGAALPDRADTEAADDWYASRTLDVLRLSSKNHVDIPIEVKPAQVFHLLASHPTPPAFDGIEDRNGRRNHDEIRFWAEYLSDAPWIYDDQDVYGGLSAVNGAPRFVVMGDMNADPLDGDSYETAIDQLKNHSAVNSDVNPESAGGTQQAALQGGKNKLHRGNPGLDTADFGDFGSSPGNLRVDHIFPSKAGFEVTGSGVFWPLTGDPLFPLLSASDHRLVWVDLIVAPVLEQSVRNLTAHRQGNDIVLTWQTQPGVSYRIEWSVDLVEWFQEPSIPTQLNVSTWTATATDVNPPDRRAYRVVVTLESE